MLFVVYDETGGTENARPVIRWGQCAAHMVPYQATNDGEVSIAVAAFDPPESATITIDPATGHWSAT